MGHKWTPQQRQAARERSRARMQQQGNTATAVLDPPTVEESLPEVGALLPTLTDLEQVVLGVEEPTDGASLEDAEDVLEPTGALGPLSAWTTPEATKKGKNFVKVNREWGGRWTTLYDHLGNDRRVLQEDVLCNIDRELTPERRRYLRCPRCVKLPNRGVHKRAGPNGCPARTPRLMTYCDICAAHGETRIIYEDHDPSSPLTGAPIDVNDPLYRPPAVPNAKSREQALQMKLDDHIRAFHHSTARQRGLRKD